MDNFDYKGYKTYMTKEIINLSMVPKVAIVSYGSILMGIEKPGMKIVKYHRILKVKPPIIFFFFLYGFILIRSSIYGTTLKNNKLPYLK